MKTILALLLVSASIVAMRLAALPPREPTADAVEAASRFLASLPASERAKAERPFDLATRKVWQFTPGDRKGTRLRDLGPEQRELVENLLKQSLSEAGYFKTKAVMSLEDILGGAYASDLYWIEVFGTPSREAPWGWQFEGHHVVLTFTYSEGRMAMTPAFFGAHPAEAVVGSKPLRALGDEEDLALALFRKLSPEQQARARIAEQVPADIFTGPGRDEELRDTPGLPGSALTEEQRSMLVDLVKVYLDDAPVSEATLRLAAIERTLDKTVFAWFGPAERGKRFYYRILGPAVLIEFDHTSASRPDDPHIHSIWRTPGSDYGEDLLKKHYLEAPHPNPSEGPQTTDDRR